ncbi:hypothetical protein ACJZ2D_010450 [Fusarium nematophilum]
MNYCPEILAALAKTHLLQLHSAGSLRHTLLAEKCASCFEFGAFLFLPTCERICFECLCRNRAYRMTGLGSAKDWFGLTDAEIRRIPIMQSIPGSYRVRNSVRWDSRTCSLVCVKQLKQLALDAHGTPEKVSSFMPEGLDHPISFKDFHTARQFHEAPLEPPGYDLSRTPGKLDWITDKYAGMASIRMPSLSSSGADYGRLCQGCRYIYDPHSLGLLPSDVLAEMVPEGADAPLLARLTRLWSRDGFVDHIRRCYGAGRLLNEWGEDQ